MPRAFFKNLFDSKAQGTIEYLGIAAIIIVISLVVVSLVISASDGSSVGEQSSKIEWSSKEISLTGGIVDSDGNWVLVIKNNSLEMVYLSSISVDGVELDLNSTQLASFETKTFLFLNDFATTACTTNSTSLNIYLNYITLDGLTKSVTGTQNLFFSCNESIIRDPNYIIFGEVPDESGGEISFDEPAFEVFLLGDDQVTFADSNISFSFFVDNYPAIKNCSLIVDGEIVLTKNSQEFNFASTNIFTHTLFENKTYSWDINCIDVNDLVISSENGPFYLILTRNFSAITTCSELQNMSNVLDGNYILMNDLDCTYDTSNPSGLLYNSGLGFAPVGTSSTPFTGTFNGSGHTISGLHIKRTSNSVGLFGYTSSTSLIANLKITDSNITGSSYVGGLVGYSQGDISLCSYDGNVNGTNLYSGGLVGYLKSGRIFGSYTTGNLYGKQYSGGLVGYIPESTWSYISDSYSQMNVSATSSYTGGFVGYCEYSYITKVYSTGSVNSSSSSFIGGFIGYGAADCYAVSSFWDTQTSGRASSSKGTGKTTVQMKTQSTFGGYDFDNTWNFSEGEYLALRNFSVYLSSPTGTTFSGGVGSLDDPYQISTCGELQRMSYISMDSNFVLVNDIDCSDTVHWVMGRGLTQIGTSSAPFNGSFDGNGFTISDLVINRAIYNYMGLFGYTSENSLIANVKLVNASVSGRNYVGGLIGYSNGNVAKVSFDGLLYARDNYAGGLIGYLNLGRIFGSYSQGEIFGNQFVGGLVGYDPESNWSYLYDVYSQMDVNASSSYVGGLVGYCMYSYITKAYSSGVVFSSSTSYIGGLVGYGAADCYVVSSFWDTQTSGKASSSKGVGKTTAELKTQSTFGGYDFDNVWNFSTNEYPFFRDYSVYFGVPTAATFSGGDGSLEDPYQISTCGELQLIADVSRDANFILINDIDCSDTVHWVMGRGFVELGTQTYSFNGSFDGNGFTISNLYINRPVFNRIGLFGYTSVNSLIANVNLVDASVSGSTYVGGLIGYSSGNVSKVSFDGLVYGRNDNVGGLIGYLNDGIIFSSSTNGDLFADQFVGGMAGYTVDGNWTHIYDSYARMNVNATSSYVGGFIGNCEDVSIARSYSTGSVYSSSSSFIGGFIGYGAADCYVHNSFWDTQTSGKASSSKGVGKTTAELKTQSTFAGYDFDNVWNFSSEEYPSHKTYSLYLTAPSSISFSGGSGTLENPYQISNCTQLQLISSYRDANYILVNDINCADSLYWSMGVGFYPIGTSSSPFLGKFDGGGYTISNLYVNRPFSNYRGLFGNGASSSLITNFGLINSSISGDTNVGGIIGHTRGQVTEVYYDGSVYGLGDYVGGLIGSLSGGGQISKSYSQGNIYGYHKVGGLMGGSTGSTVSYVNNSYSAMNTYTPYLRIGGFIGVCSYLNASKIYSAGLVSYIGSSSPTYIGGLVGESGTSCTVTDSYWDTQTSTQSSSSKGTGKTTAQMKQQATFTNWDFDNNWMIQENITYPQLRAFSD